MTENKEKYQPGPDEISHAEHSMSDVEKIMSEVRHDILTNPEFRGKKIVFIMRGVPGSGKSTVAREIAHSEGVIHSTDTYFHNEQGEYKFDPSKLSEYHDKNFEAFCKSIEQEKPVVVVDNTNIKRVHFERYIAAAKDMGYVIREIEIPAPEPATAAKRSIHGISEQTIRELLEQYDR